VDDPKRILDDANEDPTLRDLVDVGKRGEATPDQLRALAARLPLPFPPAPTGGSEGSGGAIEPSSSNVAGTSHATFGTSGWVVAGLGLAGLVALGALAVFGDWQDGDVRPEPAPERAQSKQATPSHPVALEQASPPQMRDEGSVDEQATPAAPARVRPSTRRSLRESAEPQEEPAPEAEDSMHEGPTEFELLGRARALLRGSPAAALVPLAEHRSRYPDGVLAQERDVLTIEALAGAGRVEQARQSARRFSRNYPRSPHQNRIERALGID